MLNKIEQMNRQSAVTTVKMMDDVLGGAKVKQADSLKNNFKTLVKEKDKELQQKGLRKAAQDLESLFVSMIFKQMRSSVPKDKLTGGSGREQEIFTSMFDDEIAKTIANGKGIGFANAIERQLSKKAI